MSSDGALILEACIAALADGLAGVLVRVEPDGLPTLTVVRAADMLLSPEED